MVHVRLATAADLDELTTLFEGYRQFYRQAPDPEGARAFLAERLERGDGTIFVAEASAEPGNPHDPSTSADSGSPTASNSPKSGVSAGTLLGFVQLFPSFSSVRLRPILILNDLFVSPTARKLGAGSALMKAAEDYAREQKVGRLILETEESNHKAQALYESRGWVRDPERHYGFDMDR